MGNAQRRLELEKAAQQVKQSTIDEYVKAESTTPAGYPDPLVMIAQLMQVFIDFPKIYEQADRGVEIFDYARTDLDHALELLDLPKKEQSRLTDEIKRNRVERRKAKDFLIHTEGLHGLVRKYPTIAGELIKLQSELAKVQDQQTRRTYTPRVRFDLNPMFAAKYAAAAGTSEGAKDYEGESHAPVD